MDIWSSDKKELTEYPAAVEAPAHPVIFEITINREAITPIALFVHFTPLKVPSVK